MLKFIPRRVSIKYLKLDAKLSKVMSERIYLKREKANFCALEMIKQLPILLLICEPSIRSVNPALWSRRDHG